MSGSAAVRYVRLGLRLGRHDDGVVDAHFGPAELAAAVDAEPPADPRALVADAQDLVDELDDGWLRDQVVGLRTFAGVLAGESRPYADEVAGCYGVRPRRTDEAVFAAAHDDLATLLPGTGPVAQRYRRWEQSLRVPVEQVERAVTGAVREARGRTAKLIGLPDGEGTVLEIVHDVPWLAYNFYLGGLRGRVAVNAGLPMSAIDLIVTALHETYPGHQAERCLKEHLLVRGRGLLEESIVLVPTPQSLIAEGIAELAPEMLLGGDDDGDGDGAAAFAAIMRDAGVELDVAHALAVRRTMQPCRWAEVNAALMLHEDGAGAAEVRGYLQRWGLLSPELAAHLIRFCTDPGSRTYVISYPAGQELCRSYVAGRPERLRTLLTEQVRVHDLMV
ncbi:MAG: hypothetical protein E6F99_10060 [Actinobacteria bacterium]|nr:MAG: hypothetical protein E6F99_10060 [Actinomycetota bacterium]